MFLLTAPLALINDAQLGSDDYDPFAEHKRPKIVDREDEYRQRRRNQIISPARLDPFANGGATPDVKSRGYSQIMREVKKNQNFFFFKFKKIFFQKNFFFLIY